jgi:multicomponent Na+:H+ antiporter subunit E
MWLLLFFLWIILNGRITVELVLFGILIATVMRFFADRVIGFSWQTERKKLKLSHPQIS